MNHAIIRVCFLFVMAAALNAQTAPVPDEILIKLKSDWPSADVVKKQVSDFLASGANGAALVPVSFPSSRMFHSKKWLDDIFIVRMPGTDRRPLMAAIERLPGVAYVSENHWLKTNDVTPNDSLLSRQYWVNRIGAKKAWALSHGHPSVLIGLVDSGIDDLHPDLENQIWHNAGETGEDFAGHDKRFNGIDDDGNGFIDDWRGWDFVDAPGIFDGGDHVDPDNDPTDELGHGTAVAGVLAAEANNGAGVAGLAFGCKIMNLRAGGASGFLQEDDAAQAIVYGVMNGARVLNLSFGDAAYLPLLHDAIRFAHDQGCVIVASAGNNSSPAPHYPSGFDEVVAVSATDADDFKASFSNYGTSVDVCAPGVDIWSCVSGGGYAPVSGTSFAAPLVSGLAALIWSRQASFTHEQVRSILQSSAEDIGDTGWEPYYGSGRIDAFRALQVEYATVGRIAEPFSGEGTDDSLVTVVGTAAGAFLQRVELYYGAGSNPASWTPFASFTGRQTVDDTLAVLDVHDFGEGTYTIKMSILNKDGSRVEDHVRLFVDRSAPVIRQVLVERMMAGPWPGVFVQFDTDDACDTRVWIRPVLSNRPFVPLDAGRRTRQHDVFIDRARMSGRYEAYLEAVNPSGLTTTDSAGGAFFLIDLSENPIGSSQLRPDTSMHLSQAFLTDATVDFDNDGRQEFAINEMDASGNYLGLKILEYDPLWPGKIRTEYTFPVNGVPRDACRDVSTGASYLLVGGLGQSYVYQSAFPNALPTSLAFHDTGDVWASSFLHDPSGRLQYVARKGKSHRLRTLLTNGSWELTQTLSNPTSGSNDGTLPGLAVGDFDGDGRQELLMGDYDGDLYIHEWNGQSYAGTWMDSMPLIETNGFLVSGDFDGDGRTDFAVGCHTSEAALESDLDRQYWLFRIYSGTADNQYGVRWEQYFYGYQSVQDFQSGLRAADIDHDGRDELLIGAFPSAYVVDYEAGLFQTAEWLSPCRTNTFLVDDVDRDGQMDILIATGDRTTRFAWQVDANPPPLEFAATPLDTSRVRLSWASRSDVEQFRVYRGTSDTALSLAFEISPQARDTIDAGRTDGVTYYYALVSVHSGLNSSPVFSKARPNRPPGVVSAVVHGQSQVVVTFSERVTTGISSVSSYRMDEHAFPLSAIPIENGKKVLLTFDEIPAGDHIVSVSGVSDEDRTMLDTLAAVASFYQSFPIEKFYVRYATYLGQNMIQVTFSEPVDAASAEMAAHYTMEPGFDIVSASVDDNDPISVLLSVNGTYGIGAIGIKYVLTVHGVQAISGRPLDEIDGNRVSLFFSADNLKHVFVYPNPVVAGVSPQVTFANLTPDAVVRVYAMDGRLVTEVKETDFDGGVSWDLRDHQGRRVESGVYIYVVESSSGRKRGKFAVVK